MLIKGHYPFLSDATAHMIRFQARQLGYRTDDIFLELEKPSGSRQRFLAQIKSNISFTKSSHEFQETLISAWTDFKNAELFDPAKDILAIISGPGSKKEIDHFRPLLDWSRKSVSAEDFFNKIHQPGHTFHDTQRYLSIIQKILGEQAGVEPTENELWQFLKLLNWISYDFDAPSSQNLADILNMLKFSQVIHPAIRPETIWTRLLKIAMEYNPAAGSLNRTSLINALGLSIAGSIIIENNGSSHPVKDITGLQHQNRQNHRGRTKITNRYHKDKGYMQPPVLTLNDSF